MFGVEERRVGQRRVMRGAYIKKEECVGCRLATIRSSHPFGTYSLQKQNLSSFELLGELLRFERRIQPNFHQRKKRKVKEKKDASNANDPCV